MSKKLELRNPKEEEEEPELEEEDLEEEDYEDDEDDMPGSEGFAGMLDAVLSRHLEYSQDDSTLTLAEILLLIKQSIDSQNAILGEMLRLKMAKYGQSSGHSSHASGSGHHRSGSSLGSNASASSAARQETPEERAIRKARAAAKSAQ